MLFLCTVNDVFTWHVKYINTNTRIGTAIDEARSVGIIALIFSYLYKQKSSNDSSIVNINHEIPHERAWFCSLQTLRRRKVLLPCNASF